MKEDNKQCPNCKGYGWITAHDTGAYSHDEDDNCLGYCPIKVVCGECMGEGKIKEASND